MAGLDLTKVELQLVLILIENKSVKVINPAEYEKYQVIQKKLLDYLSGPGLDLGGEE